MKRFARNPLKFGTLLVAAFLLACSGDNSQAGGGIWDETENGLAVRIVDDGGLAIANARVRLVNGTASVADSAYSDSTGTAWFKRPAFNGYAEISGASGVARMAFVAGDSSVCDTVRAPSSLSITLSADRLSNPSELYLFSTSFRASVSSAGEAVFDSLPAGDFAVLSASDSGFVFWGSEKVFLDSVTDAVLAEPATDSVLVDDFEDAFGTNLFYALTGGGWWFTFADSASSVSPALPAQGLVRSADSAWDGSQSLHEVLTIDSTVSGAYALCGVDLGVSHLLNSAVSYDMSGTDSVTFYIRGSGHILLQFAGYEESGTARNWDFEFDIPSTTTWTRVSVLPPGNADWEAIKSRMTTVTFLATGDTDLWLDQLVFYGISAGELFGSLLSR